LELLTPNLFSKVIRFAGLILFLIISSYADYLFADNRLNRENQIKAVYLTHFAELTRWPEKLDHDTTFTICLYDQPLLVPFLEELSHELINNKQLKVVQIESLNIQNNCRIIYFNNTDTIESEPELSALYPEMLLIGNSRQFVKNGGSISFVLEENKIKLIINLGQVRHSGLDISSKLLRIAEVIE